MPRRRRPTRPCHVHARTTAGRTKSGGFARFHRSNRYGRSHQGRSRSHRDGDEAHPGRSTGGTQRGSRHPALTAGDRRRQPGTHRGLLATRGRRLSGPRGGGRQRRLSAGRHLETRDDHCITVRGSVASASEPLILSRPVPVPRGLHGFELEKEADAVCDTPAALRWPCGSWTGGAGTAYLVITSPWPGINGRLRPSRPRRPYAAPVPEQRAGPGTAGTAPPAGRQGLPPG